MRSLKQVILDFIFNERPAYLSTTSLSYWLKVERKREVDKGRNVLPKRAKVNEKA